LIYVWLNTYIVYVCLEAHMITLREIQTERNQDFKEKQKILSGLLGEMVHSIDKKPNKKKEHFTRNKINDKKKSHKNSKESFMRKLLSESKEFANYEALYVRKISFSERKKINLNNIIPQIYLNTDKKSKITIRNSTKEKLEDLKPIFVNLDSAINSLFDFFIYIEYCMVKGNDAK